MDVIIGQLIGTFQKLLKSMLEVPELKTTLLLLLIIIACIDHSWYVHKSTCNSKVQVRVCFHYGHTRQYLLKCNVSPNANG